MRHKTPLLISLIMVTFISFACKERKSKVKNPINAKTQLNIKGKFKNNIGQKKSDIFWESIWEEKILTKRQINRLKKIETNNWNEILEFSRTKGKMTSKIREDFDLKKRLKYKEYLGDSLYILFAIETKNIEEGKTKRAIIKSN